MLEIVYSLVFRIRFESKSTSFALFLSEYSYFGTGRRGSVDIFYEKLEWNRSLHVHRRTHTHTLEGISYVRIDTNTYWPLNDDDDDDDCGVCACVCMWTCVQHDTLTANAFPIFFFLSLLFSVHSLCIVAVVRRWLDLWFSMVTRHSPKRGRDAEPRGREGEIFGNVIRQPLLHFNGESNIKRFIWLLWLCSSWMGTRNAVRCYCVYVVQQSKAVIIIYVIDMLDAYIMASLWTRF